MTGNLPLEELYYEFDGFWNPSSSVLGLDDAERVSQARSLVPANVESVLDLGCGNGIFCNQVREQTPHLQVIGLDRSRTALQYVNTDKLVGNVMTIPFGNRTFDCVVALELLEHLPVQPYQTAMKEIARVARHCILVSVPNNQILGQSLTECPTCHSRFDPDLHLRSFDSATMASLYSTCGFECEEIREIGVQRTLRGLGLWSSLKRRGQAKRMAEMQSPICPICGHTNDRFLQRKITEYEQAPGDQARKPHRIKSFLKSVWPRSERSRWLLCLYVRTNSSHG